MWWPCAREMAREMARGLDAVCARARWYTRAWQTFGAMSAELDGAAGDRWAVPTAMASQGKSSKESFVLHCQLRGSSVVERFGL